jgi:hypothetical protein
MKSYNMQALRGHEYDDKEFQADMQEVGIHIPNSLLYTKDLGQFVINAVHQQAIEGLPEVMNPQTGEMYTQEEARKEADTNRGQATSMYNKLLDMK